MDGKLKNAAIYFEFDPDEIEKEDYSFRYDATFWPGSTYIWYKGIFWLAVAHFPG